MGVFSKARPITATQLVCKSFVQGSDLGSAAAGVLAGEAGRDSHVGPHRFGTKSSRLILLDETFDFGTIAHATVAEGIGFGMDYAGAAMSFARLVARDLYGHADGGF